MKDVKNIVIRFIRSVKFWQLLALTALSAIICIFALRANNEHMNTLRDDLYAADKNGGNVEAALENLENYVTSNMNTSLTSGPNSVYPPIQLTYSYDRSTASEAQSLQQQNSSLYTEAEDYCQAEVPEGYSGRYRVPCIEQFVTSHGLDQANLPTALYQFDFISPTWSPDLAGWTLISTIILAVLSIVSLVMKWVRRRSES